MGTLWVRAERARPWGEPTSSIRTELWIRLKQSNSLMYVMASTWSKNVSTNR